MKKAGFEERLLSKLDKLDADQIQGYLANILNQRQFLAQIFDHLDEGIVVTTLDLKVLFANSKARSMLGRPRMNWEGERLNEVISQSHPLAEVIGSLTDHPRRVEGYECLWGQRQERLLVLSTLLMRPQETDLEAAAELLIILLRDETERLHRQNEQTRARRLAALATLTAGIAHEVKNPLNSINIHAQLLQREVEQARDLNRPPNVARTERATDVILEESRRLTQIVDDFIQAARPRSADLVSTDLRNIFDQVQRLFGPECEQKGVELTFSTDPELPPLMLDGRLMIQALRNLLRNALEAVAERAESERDGAAQTGAEPTYVPRIELDARLGGDSVLIEVIDNGMGIEETKLEQIFEPYYTTKPHGSGLGLMVVYRIVTEHRGALHVDTHAGEGTRFIITLPLHQRPVRLLQSEGEAVKIPELDQVDDTVERIEKTTIHPRIIKSEEELENL